MGAADVEHHKTFTWLRAADKALEGYQRAAAQFERQPNVAACS